MSTNGEGKWGWGCANRDGEGVGPVRGDRRGGGGVGKEMRVTLTSMKIESRAR